MNVIQYLCESCGQPIEVDAAYAQRDASCPYCQKLGRVPAESTYRPPGRSETPIQAAPVGPPPLPAPNQRLSSVLGWWALACGLISMLASITLVVTALTVSWNDLLRIQQRDLSSNRPMSFQPVSREEAEELQKRVQQAAPWFPAVNCVALLLAPLALSLGAASIGVRRSWSWSGGLGALLGGLQMGCYCAGIALNSV